MSQFFFVLAFILFTAYAGYNFRALTRSGAIAAVFAGMAVYLGFRVEGLLLLGAFAVTSSIWSKYKSSEKEKIEDKLAKSGTRDWQQVLANGGGAAIFSMLEFIHHDVFWVIGFAVCIASANSDTWASEIGSLSKRKPIYIKTGKRTERGTSGAISLLGSVAGLAGSLLIALLSQWLFQLNHVMTLAIFLFGFIGNMVDTLMGAFIQQVYVCGKCGLETEKEHHCGLPTTKLKGLPFMNNEMVNFLSGFLAALVSLWAIHAGIYS